MRITIASCVALACSVVLSGCIVDDTDVDPTHREGALVPKDDENGIWTKTTDGVWERTRPNNAQEEYVIGVPGMTWKVQQQEETLEAFRENVRGLSGENLSEEQQRTLKMLQENLEATQKALEEISLPASAEPSAPSLHPEYDASGVPLGNCVDYLVAGPTPGTGAYTYSSINPQCPSYYLSAYSEANGLSFAISSNSNSNSRSVYSYVTNGTYHCSSQAYVVAKGWGHTLTYPFCL